MEADAMQTRLPFSEAEGTYQERLNWLGLALLRVDADLQLAQLMRWIFNTTHGGLSGEFRKSYKEIAAKPWGLCCDPSTARRKVKAAETYGWLTVEGTVFASGGDSANALTIDWEGVKRSLDLSRRPTHREPERPAAAAAPPRHSEQGDRHNAYPPRHSEQGDRHCAYAYKEYHLLDTSLDTTTPNPSPQVEGTPTSGADWAAAAAGLREAGVERIDPTIAECRRTGKTPGEVLAVVAEFRRDRHRFDGPGALIVRLRDGCWPVGAATTVDRAAVVEARERAADANRATLAEVRAPAEAERERFAALWARHGPALEALGEARQRELVLSITPAAALKFMPEGGPLWRSTLLEAWLAEVGPAEHGLPCEVRSG